MLKQHFHLTCPCLSTLANNAGERWCRAEDPCIIQGPFPRAGSALGIGRTSVTQRRWPWVRDLGQTSPSPTTNYPARKGNSLCKLWNMRAVSNTGDSHWGWQAWPAFTALFIYLVTICHSMSNLEFSRQGFLPCFFSTGDKQGGMGTEIPLPDSGRTSVVSSLCWGNQMKSTWYMVPKIPEGD